MNDARWVDGDETRLGFPADPTALIDGGPAFLTKAFHRFGVLDAANSVARLKDCTEVTGGSTGRKLMFDVEYTHPNGLPSELFVKFSRDFDDPRRDRGRTQMDLEVRFATLARAEFPITVPVTLFADYHRESGTGILVTERIPYGADGVEPHYPKCLDYRMPEPLEHYRALLMAVARLAGAHKAGRLAPEFYTEFAFDPARVGVGERKPVAPEALRTKVSRYAEFSTQFPGFLPEAIRTPQFLTRMAEEVAAIGAAERAVLADLSATDAHVALCHWNANVDNAWFFRDGGSLQCGLLDWGCVSEMNIAMPLWGALCSAEAQVWDHVDELLTDFADAFADAGGPALDPAQLHRQLVAYAVVMGVAWLLDAPGYIRSVVPDLDTVADRYDPRIADNEVARTQLLMMTNFLRLWQGTDATDILR
jgi:hypothetical protein